MEPASRRPYMPGYGLKGAEEGSGLLPWSWAEERLARCRDYWICTIWPDGRPHVAPVWGVWALDRGWFSSSRGSRKARNLEGNPRAVMTTSDPLEPVVVEGVVSPVTDDPRIVSFAAWSNAKYETDIPVDFYRDNACFELTPLWAYGLREEDFTGSPTRWQFRRP